MCRRTQEDNKSIISKRREEKEREKERLKGLCRQRTLCNCGPGPNGGTDLAQPKPCGVFSSQPFSLSLLDFLTCAKSNNVCLVQVDDSGCCAVVSVIVLVTLLLLVMQ